MNSKNNYNFINYDFNTKGVSLLSQEKQNFYISSIKNQLINTINDYISKKLNEQDIFLFGFNEDTLLNKDNKKNFVAIIQKLIETIEESENYNFIQNQRFNFHDVNQGIYNMTYNEICAFANYIIIILKSVPKKKREKIYDLFYSEGKIPDSKLELDGIKIQKIMTSTDSIKQINICISEKDFNILERKEENKF